MTYKCKKCKKEFPIAGWIEYSSTLYFPTPPQTLVSTNLPQYSTRKTPCCPFCGSIEIEELK